MLRRQTVRPLTIVAIPEKRTLASDISQRL
jgi:hypothetical protein